MTIANVRTALETALNGVSPAIATAWENVDFTPPDRAVPYQRVNLLPATPDDIEMSGKKRLEIGILQVSLLYPLDKGPADAYARAELLRETFYRGASFASGGVSVDIRRTPIIGPAMNESDRYMLPVRIGYSAQISRS